MVARKWVSIVRQSGSVPQSSGIDCSEYVHWKERQTHDIARCARLEIVYDNGPCGFCVLSEVTPDNIGVASLTAGETSPAIQIECIVARVAEHVHKVFVRASINAKIVIAVAAMRLNGRDITTFEYKAIISVLAKGEDFLRWIVPRARSEAIIPGTAIEAV